MFHNFMVGNIVRTKKDGQIMRINGVRQNPIDGTLSGYVVCTWVDKYGIEQMKSFHVDELDFISEGNSLGIQL